MKRIKLNLEQTEAQIQKCCLQWFRYQYPASLIFHIPNAVKFVSGHNRGRFFGILKELKELGMEKGVPDLFIPHPVKGYAGLWIEMKRPGRGWGREQKELAHKLIVGGYRVELCQSFEDFRRIVQNYFDNLFD